MKPLFQCSLAVIIVSIAFAQDLVFNHDIPEDLAVDVDSNTPDFFFNFDGDAEEDGVIASFGGDSEGVASAPDFYISDSPTTLSDNTITLLVGMIRTTPDQTRSLHWLVSETRTSSSRNSQGAESESSSSQQETLLPYQAPGTNGETGIQYYTFVVWTAGPDVDIVGLPEGEDQVLEDFDVEQFEEENNLEGPVAVADMGIEVTTDDDKQEEEVAEEVADNESNSSSSEDEDIDETIDNDGSSDFDATDAALAFDMVSSLALAVICSGTLGLLLMT